MEVMRVTKPFIFLKKGTQCFGEGPPSLRGEASTRGCVMWIRVVMPRGGGGQGVVVQYVITEYAWGLEGLWWSKKECRVMYDGQPDCYAPCS